MKTDTQTEGVKNPTNPTGGGTQRPPSTPKDPAGAGSL